MEDTEAFTEKLHEATSGHFQLTTDGYKPYENAVSYSLGTCVDFAQLIKVYATNREGEQKYSPPEVVETITKIQIGDPDPSRICTSIVERSNLSMRTSIHRLTPPDKRFQQEVGTPKGNARGLLCLLQLLPDSLKHSLYPSDGVRNHATRLDFEGFTCCLEASMGKTSSRFAGHQIMTTTVPHLPQGGPMEKLQRPITHDICAFTGNFSCEVVAQILNRYYSAQLAAFKTLVESAHKQRSAAQKRRGDGMKQRARPSNC